jgi:phage gpG-like protein
MPSNLTYSGFDRVRRKIRAINPDLVDSGPKIGNIIARHVRRQFATKGAHFGTPWRPLAASTRKQKRQLGLPAAPLVRSGKLKHGVTRAPMDVEIYTHTSGIFGTASRKAKWQHFGTFRKGKRHIPPRTILKKTPTIERDIRAALHRQITRRL